MTPEGRIRAWLHRWALVLLGVVVLALSVLSVVQTVRADRAERASNVAIERVVGCLRTFADGVASAITARSTATEQRDDAELAMWTALFNAPPTAEGRELSRRTFADYLAARAKAKAERAAHPYPEPPRVQCARQ